ncbi:MAG TPA: cupin domain-containing protein [Flavitalea sp.]|nr:cupin domain-containing protein [Flavitalea sp.]
MSELNLLAEMSGDEFVKELNLELHPEGGYYRQTYRSTEYISRTALPDRFAGDRAISTAIFYLLQQGDFSAFHRIKSDECWHFYFGGALFIHIIKHNGEYLHVKLGKNIREGENFQYVVPAKAWFAVEPAPETAFALTGCTVAPGFDFSDFEIGDKQTLLSLFPQHARIIKRLSR